MSLNPRNNKNGVTGTIIRIYRFPDKSSIRKICSDTADLGEPVENFFYDREVFADLMTDYYTAFEPACLWVAECQQEVIGYLSGCMDSRRYLRIMRLNIIPGVFIRAIRRGLLWHKDTWRFSELILKNLLLGGFNRRDIFSTYPAHLHINLKEDFRHHGLGSALVERFFAQVRQANLSGVQASVCQDNRSACGFFERLGFSVLETYPMVRFHKTDGFKTSNTLIYGRRL